MACRSTACSVLLLQVVQDVLFCALSNLQVFRPRCVLLQRLSFPLVPKGSLLCVLSLLKRFTYRPLPAQVSCFILSLTFLMFFRPVDFFCSFCPSLPILLQASLLGCYRAANSKGALPAWQRSCLPHPQGSGAEQDHLIPS